MSEQQHRVPDRAVPEDGFGAVRVLLVEDNPAEVDLVREMLRESTAISFTTESVPTLREASERLSTSPPDLVVLDLSLPDSEGVGTCRELTASFPGVPVVVMTGNADETLALRVLQAGAHGYLRKGEAGPALLARTLWHALERHRLSRKLESAAEREEQLATHDAMTRLPNRMLFTDRLSQAVKAAKQEKLAVVVVDLDRLRRINDRFSYGDGDELLRRVGERLRSCIRSGESLARIGGDEFGVVLSGIRREIDAARVGKRILDVLREPIAIQGHACVVTASLGIAAYPNDGDDPEILISRAEVALYHAKQRGGNRYEFYSPELNSTAAERLDLEHELRCALEQGQLVAYFQPKVDAERRRIAGTEALARWRHPERGLVPPGKFIPVAEEAGLIDALGDWILREACRQGRIWQDRGLPGIPVAVNVSARQFENGDFPARVCAALEDSGLVPSALELEVTESTLMSNPTEVGEALTVLKEFGVRIAIDDFGTGYSSLAALRHLPVDCLKIDRCFVQRMADDALEARLVESIVTLARGLELEVVAEGVETAEQAELLCAIGCQSLQGFLFAQPMPANEIEPMLLEPSVSWEKAAG